MGSRLLQYDGKNAYEYKRPKAACMNERTRIIYEIYIVDPLRESKTEQWQQYESIHAHKISDLKCYTNLKRSICDNPREISWKEQECDDPWRMILEKTSLGFIQSDDDLSDECLGWTRQRTLKFALVVRRPLQVSACAARYTLQTCVVTLSAEIHWFRRQLSFLFNTACILKLNSSSQPIYASSV